MLYFLIGLFTGAFWGFVIAGLLRAAAGNDLKQEVFTAESVEKPIPASSGNVIEPLSPLNDTRLNRDRAADHFYDSTLFAGR